jgi:hypothetical protein
MYYDKILEKIQVLIAQTENYTGIKKYIVGSGQIEVKKLSRKTLIIY